MPDVRILNYIGGELVEPAGGQYIENIEPGTGRVYSAIPDSDERDVNAAVSAASDAFAAWSSMPPSERAACMDRVADLIMSRVDELARAESVDNGKPLWLARAIDIPRSATNLRFFAGAVTYESTELFHTNSTGLQGAHALNYTLRSPRGVAGCISPWNLPLYLLTWKIAPALATGNTVVAKPSEVTPMTAYLLSEICIEAGLPAGVLNIVHGAGVKVGGPLVSHPEVPTISFTGGTATGKAIAAATAPMFKRVSLELGGKNPNVLFADARLDGDDGAVAGAVRAGFTNQGQICLCGSRILVERSIYDSFVDRLVEQVAELRPGDPLDPESRQGALVSAEHRDKVASYVDLARELGGVVRCGGKPVDPDRLPERCRGGYYFEPTVITGLAHDCRVIQEEIFGPVVTVSPFDSEIEAIAMANATPYGLASSVWSQDISRAHRVANGIDAGVVWVNCWMVRDLRTPFGGMKQSGVGREGGTDALKFFTEAKNVCVNVG